MRITIIFISLIFTAYNMFSQCSDAGVCVIGKRHNIESVQYNNSLTLGYNNGNSGSPNTGSANDNDITYHQVRLDIEVKPFETSRLILAAPFNYNKGTFGSASGVGDVIFLWDQAIPLDNVQSINLYGGVKMPTGKSDIDSLPQSYQPGSGTTDILFGAGYTFGSFYAAAGYQKTLGNSQHFTKYKKGDDVLFRAGWNEGFNKLRIKAEVLTIKRINKSEVINFTVPAVETYAEIPDSDFTQVNILGQLTYLINKTISVSGFAAFPLLKRNENSDSSRRSYTFGVSFNYLVNIDY